MKIYKADYKNHPTLKINWQTLPERTWIAIGWILDQINNDPKRLTSLPYSKNDIDDIESGWYPSPISVHMHDGTSWEVEIHRAYNIDNHAEVVDLETVGDVADEPWEHLTHRSPREKELLSAMEKALSLECIEQMKTLLIHAIANADNKGEKQ
jgi:hypothetical protein